MRSVSPVQMKNSLLAKSGAFAAVLLIKSPRQIHPTLTDTDKMNQTEEMFRLS